MGNLATPGKAVAVTPSDATELTGRGTLYIGVSGDLNVILADMTTALLYKNVPVGDFPRRVKQVLATNTTATDIIQDL